MISLPIAFVERMKTTLQHDLDTFCKVLDTEAVSSIRINPFKEYRPDDKLESVPWCEEGYYLPKRPSFVFEPLFHAGAYYVQEASSMVLSQMLEMRPNMRMLDLCGAPGGKSTLLASYMEKGSFLVANEVIQSRAKILAENLTRWGNPHTIVTQNDPSDFGRYLQGYFDLVVVDAPCSGEGMFRKEPASRNEWSEEAVWHCASRQRRILADVIPALAPGGQLIYSTCTYAKAENEDIIAWLLEEFEEFDLYPVSDLDKFGAIGIQINGVKNAAYRCMPHKMKGEGLFICRLRKKGESEIIEPKTKPSRKRKREKNSSQKNTSQQKIIKEFFEAYCETTEYSFNILNDLLLLQSSRLQSFPFQKFKTLKKGLLAGKIHRKGINPTHELAMSSAISKDIPFISLNKEKAIRYLQKQDLQSSFDLPIKHGWILAKFDGVNLGWLKIVNGRLKNHFPTNWRIRKLL